MYKTLIQEIGRLVKSALPFAIVDSAPSNWFVALTSYRTVQAAIDAGNLWIKIKDGTYPPFNVTNAYTRIDGSHGVVIDGEANTAHAVKVTASHCTITGIAAKTLAGGATTYQAFHAGATWTQFIDCLCLDSDGYGFGSDAGSTATYSAFINCEVLDCDGWAFHLSSNFQRVEGCVTHSNAGGGSSGVYLTNTYADGCNIVGNVFGGTGYQIDSGCNVNTLVGNSWDAAGTDNGTSNTIANNGAF